MTHSLVLAHAHDDIRDSSDDIADDINYGVCTSWRDVDDIKQDIRGGEKLDFRRKGFSHVGIAGDKGDVLHYSGEPKRKAGAEYRCDPLEDVAGGCKVRINNREDRRFKPLPPEQIVERARRNVGTGKGEYDLLRNNCEHRATDMRYEKPMSGQVNTGMAAGAGVGGVALLTAGAIGGIYHAVSHHKKHRRSRGDDVYRRLNKHHHDLDHPSLDTL